MTHTAGEVAQYLGARLEGDALALVSGVASPDRAGAEDLIYVDSPRHRGRAVESAARCVLVRPSLRLAGKTIIETSDPKFAFAKAAAWLLRKPPPPAVVHPTAIVGSRAHPGANVSGCPSALVGGD